MSNMKKMKYLILVIMAFGFGCKHNEFSNEMPTQALTNEQLPEELPAQELPTINETIVEPVQSETQPTSTWVETPEPPNFGYNRDTEKPNILILGDSISIGYTGNVIENLKDKYDVNHPTDNCRNSYYFLNHMDEWTTQFNNNDIITFNTGLWDSVRTDWYKQFINGSSPEEWYSVSLDNYESNLINIARKLKSTGARIIFFTTTDIPEKSGVFEIGKELKLNEIAKRVLPSEGIEVYDLYSFGLTLENAHTSPIYGDVHFTNNSRKLMGDYVSNIILNK